MGNIMAFLPQIRCEIILAFPSYSYFCLASENSLNLVYGFCRRLQREKARQRQAIRQKN